jgi:hypothetical protein
MDNNEKQTLQYCLDNTYKVHGINHVDKVWYMSDDNLISVAKILNGEKCFKYPETVIVFFEKPDLFEAKMKELVERK